LHLAKRLVDETDLSMADVAFAAGFGSVRRFNAVFRETYGRTPGSLRRRRREPPAGALTLRLLARPPFDFASLLAFLAPRAIPGVERVDGGVYRRTLSIDGSRGLIEVRAATEPGVVVQVHTGDPRVLGTIVERVRSLFDLDADPGVIAAHLRRDRRLRPLLGPGGVRVPGPWEPFETAVRAVLGQQITVRAATTLAGRLVEAYGEVLEPGATEVGEGNGEPRRIFPWPEALVDADLAALGMPGRRAETLRRLAGAVHDGTLRLDGADPEEVIERLREIPGIGEWTAQYMAMRVLREPDALPAGDLGLRKALAVAPGCGLASEQEVREAAEAWRPWRAYAAMALWRGVSAKAPQRASSKARTRRRVAG
jgi:AraC family transcriptional regulator of adaptative response / DNA-3-methyladenine glycosylase II